MERAGRRRHMQRPAIAARHNLAPTMACYLAGHPLLQWQHGGSTRLPRHLPISANREGREETNHQDGHSGVGGRGSYGLELVEKKTYSLERKSREMMKLRVQGYNHLFTPLVIGS